MDRRSWLGIATLLMLGLLYMQIPALFNHQTAHNGRLDLSAWHFENLGPVQLDSHWSNWQSNNTPGDDSSYSLDLGNIGRYLYADDLAILLQPTCQQTSTSIWHSEYAGEVETMPLSFTLNKPVLIGLTPYLNGDRHKIEIQTHNFNQSAQTPCLKLFIGSSQQLSQVMSWSLVLEIAPVAMLTILLLTLIGRAIIQTYYVDLLWLGLTVTSLLLYTLSKSSTLVFNLSQTLDLQNICNVKVTAAGLVGSGIFLGLYCLRQIAMPEAFKIWLKRTLLLNLVGLTLLPWVSAENRHWLGLMLSGVFISNQLMSGLVLAQALRVKTNMDTVYKLILSLLIALGIADIYLDLIDDYTLIIMTISLLLVIRMNLTLYPTEETKLAPHEATKLREDIRRHTADLEDKNRELQETKLALEVANRELQALSVTDGLTGAYNRLYFDRQFLLEWQRARREQENLSLILVDIDHFKELNDRHGHLAGDEGLKQVTQILQNTFQRGNDFVCRYGGEEFVILLPNTSPEQAAIRADKAREQIEMTPVTFEEKVIPITISIGVAGLTPRDNHQPLDLLHAADQALYWVKRNGRNGVKIADTVEADQEKQTKATERLTPEAG
jgi:diguanylate cyclase (GGDEF)-like protein